MYENEQKGYRIFSRKRGLFYKGTSKTKWDDIGIMFMSVDHVMSLLGILNGSDGDIDDFVILEYELPSPDEAMEHKTGTAFRQAVLGTPQGGESE
ncbi:hypothetical protein [Methyloversatilis sp.]|uniref:hypothetical protein n=1 Tax=Methyloversatilis sp. TaxID=2569862 RepID=UPI0035B3A805